MTEEIDNDIKIKSLLLIFHKKDLFDYLEQIIDVEQPVYLFIEDDIMVVSTTDIPDDELARIMSTFLNERGEDIIKTEDDDIIWEDGEDIPDDWLFL